VWSGGAKGDKEDLGVARRAGLGGAILGRANFLNKNNKSKAKPSGKIHFALATMQHWPINFFIVLVVDFSASFISGIITIIFSCKCLKFHVGLLSTIVSGYPRSHIKFGHCFPCDKWSPPRRPGSLFMTMGG
jgi:hypothetical protein